MKFCGRNDRYRFDSLAHAEGRLRPAQFTRAYRKRLVVVAAVLLALLWANVPVVYLLAPSTTAMVLTFTLWALVLVGWLVVQARIIPATRGAVGLPDHLLDERQKTEKLRARALAHKGTLILLMVAYFGTIFGAPGDADVTRLPAATIPMPFIALIATVAALPTLILAWRLPDPPAEDE